MLSNFYLKVYEFVFLYLTVVRVVLFSLYEHCCPQVGELQYLKHIHLCCSLVFVSAFVSQTHY